MTTQSSEPNKAEFVALFAGLDRGRVATDATDALHELIGRVTETGKPGSLTFVLKVAPAKGSTDQVKVTAGLATKLPQPDARELLFFVTSDGNLSRSDPAQSEFNFVPSQESR